MDQFHDDYSLAPTDTSTDAGTREAGGGLEETDLVLEVADRHRGEGPGCDQWPTGRGMREDADIRDEVRVCPECGLFHIKKPPCKPKSEKVRL